MNTTGRISVADRLPGGIHVGAAMLMAAEAASGFYAPLGIRACPPDWNLHYRL
jgi:hypothetical protein